MELNRTHGARWWCSDEGKPNSGRRPEVYARRMGTLAEAIGYRQKHSLWDLRFSRRQVWSWLSCGTLYRVVWWKWTNVSEELLSPSSGLWVILMVETVSSPETSVNFYQTTRCNISEDGHLQKHAFFTLIPQNPCKCWDERTCRHLVEPSGTSS
jgi:hypothetical protein